MPSPLVTRRKLVLVRTLGAEGENEPRQLVRCSRQRTTLSSETCMKCPRLGELQLQDGMLAALYCDGGDNDSEQSESPPLSLPRVSVQTVMAAQVTCVRAEVTLDAVSLKFLEGEHDVLPVVDDAGSLLGFVTESDVQLDIHAHAGDREGGVRTVGDVMAPWPLAVPEHMPLTQAAAVLAYEGQHHLAVVSRAGQIVGILSSGQILAWLANADGYVF